MARSPRCPSQGKGWVPMPRQCGRPRCDLVGEPGPGPLGREGCQGLPLPPETNHVRPDTMEHVEKVRPQLLSLRQLAQGRILQANSLAIIR
jgi:hypothetical protein